MNALLPIHEELSRSIDAGVDRASFRSMMLGSLRRYRDQEALSDGTRSWNFGELEQRIQEYCGAFAAAGLRPGDGVGLLGMNTLEYAALQLAVPLSGMYFTSLYELESTKNHAAQIEYAGLRAVIVDPITAPGRTEELAGALGSDVQLFSLVPNDAALDLRGLVASSTPVRPSSVCDPHQITEIGLTGGTTGHAKGVIDTDSVYAHQALIHAANYGLPPRPKMLISTPLSHGIGSVALKTVLLLGGSCVLQPRFDPDRVLQTVEAERISSLLLVPTSVYRILDSSEIGRRDTSSLECLLYGGSPMSPDRAGEAIDRFGRVLVQQYGSREAKVVAILGRDDHDPTDSAVMSSAGRQCLGVNLQVLDADLRPVPIGEVGEICTRSPASVPGYWRRDDESRELLRGGWVHSGDLAVADERGFVTIKDRIKQVIISGGHNVVPREVEDALAAHPDVALAAVFGVPDANWGEAVQAVVVPRPGAATIDTADLRQFVKDRVGSVNAPKNIEVRGELPLTTAGKVDKPALRRPYWKDQSRDVG